MKVYLFKRHRVGFFLLVASCFFLGEAFGKEPKYTLKIKDKMTRKTSSEDSEKGNNFVTIETTEEISTLTVKAKMVGGPRRNCQLEWAFLSEVQRNQNNTPVINFVAGGKKAITLDDGKEEEVVLISDPFVSTETITASNRGTTTRFSTSTCEGYIVLLTADGEILAQDASSSKYLKDEWIEKVRGSSKKK